MNIGILTRVRNIKLLKYLIRIILILKIKIIALDKINHFR